MYDVIVTVYKGLVDVIKKRKDVSLKVINEDQFDHDGNYLTDIYQRGNEIVKKRLRKRHKKH